jgi:hypothetical protein
MLLACSCGIPDGQNPVVFPPCPTPVIHVKPNPNGNGGMRCKLVSSLTALGSTLRTTILTFQKGWFSVIAELLNQFNAPLKIRGVNWFGFNVSSSAAFLANGLLSMPSTVSKLTTAWFKEHFDV